MTSTDVALGVLLVSLCGVAVTGLIIAGRWIERRASAGDHIDTFAEQLIAHPSDVAAADAEVDVLIALAQIEDELDMALAPLREPK